MKKLLLFAFVILIQVKIYGQALPNGTFENWNSTAYNDPTGWNTGNIRDLQKLGNATVTKVTGFAGFAIRIQTIAAGFDTSESFAINTINPCNDPSQWAGGMPYSGQPTAITGYYRYNLPGNDTALLIIIFRKNGVHIGENIIKIKGTSGSQNTFAAFSFPVTCIGMPDSVIFAATSSNKLTNVGVHNGSFLELDNLAFAGTTQTIPNGNFENWTAKSIDIPDGWKEWNNGVSRTLSSYGGSYAVRLETLSDCGGNSNISSSGITTGYLTNHNGPAGGRPYINLIDTLRGYYKYTPVGNDSANITISLTNNSSTPYRIDVGSALKEFPAAASYTYFEIPIIASQLPDTMRIDIQSSKMNATSSNMGSALYLDNLFLASSPLGIFETTSSFRVTNSYPNPVKDLFTVQFEKNLFGSVSLSVYDIIGRQVNVNDFNVNLNLMKLDVSNLQAGLYYYEIKTPNGMAKNKFVKE